MAVLRVQTDYIDYMTVHTISTYQDIRMRYIEFIRNAYHYFGLSINPKTRISKIDALKEIVKAHGLNPEEVLTKEALSMPNRTLASNTILEENQVKILSKTLRDAIKNEL